ncbi:hypothetical protein LAZ67_18000868 [Cordylochernes scorpioides]|uniref:RNase H type-1 domain-containing protein n=1 Tax=Cordylochernes scorpioides TaxID=51811 RepID=A0ABY6LJE1_9ARAC|nr:hypothetical protein LAZ67_18000868 [Cordylochernes scorpioides]
MLRLVIKQNAELWHIYCLFQTGGNFLFSALEIVTVQQIFSAELVAIREALRVCAEKNFSPDRLYSDCRSALVAINLENGQLAHQIIQELEMMTRAPELHCVRGHSLIEGNEFADRLAKAGCFRGRSVRTPVTNKEVYRRIRVHVQDLWLDRWRNSVKGNEGSSGHGPFPRSLHRFKIKSNPDCVCGERDVDARHYVLDCPRVVGVQEERRRARGAIESELLRNHSKLLEKAHEVEAELFLSYIEKNSITLSLFASCDLPLDPQAWLFGVGLHPEAVKLTSVAKATIYKYHLNLELGNASQHIDLPTL